jgi:SAM-dependent methyltransferase/predicted O-methyltransferase YrrM
MDDDPTQIADALQRVRELTEAQLPLLSLPDRTLDPATLPRFSPNLRAALAQDEIQRLQAEIQRLSPWLQGPFYLGGELVIEGIWRNDGRWAALGEHVRDLSGKRVLDVGSNAGYDPFMFHMLGAHEVVACEPFEFMAQAHFLESIYRTGIHFEQIGWQQLDPEVHGRFDLIHCNGVLYHEPNPMGMLRQLRAMLRDDGELLLGSMMLEDPVLSEYARFVRHDYASDPTWWWVPGRLALRWMMDAAGLEAEVLPFRFGGPAGAFTVVNGYLRGRAGEPDEQLRESAQTRPSTARSSATDVDAAPRNRFPVGHYYSPMYDTRELASRRDRLWPPTPRETVGIDWKDRTQLELCQVFARQQKLDFIDDPGEDPTVYYASNDQYPPLDAWVLAGILEQRRPRRMIEVGSGFSTLVSARVDRERLDLRMKLTCIEPYPRDFLTAGVDGVSELRVEQVQDTPMELYSELSAGDVLFVDTAHTVKTGGDVTWIFAEVIPRLAPGVLVHIHDVFLPGDYPPDWVMEGWGWNENYLVRAFLSFNDQFDIVWGSQYMLHNHRDEVIAAFPGLAHDTPSGASLWIERRTR